MQSLLAHGAERAFGVAGESYLAVLDALYDVQDRIELVTNRQEGGAAFMAEAYAKLTGKTGLCFVTRGPGACNASIGVHTARQDSTPMILFVGQVAREQMGREAFQEIDYRQMFKPPIAKAVFQVDSADKMNEIMAEAFRLTQSGRKGPVVIALPEDVLTETAGFEQAIVTPPKAKTDIKRDLEDACKLLREAKRPVCIIGGSGWSEEAIDNFQAFAEREGLPVATSFRRQDLFDHNSPVYIGELGTGANPELVRLIRDESGLVLAVNTRLSEITSQGYTLLDVPKARQKLIHIYPDIDEHGHVYRADVGILSKPDNFIDHIHALSGCGNCEDWRQKLRDQYTKWSALPQKRDLYAPDMNFVYGQLIDKMSEDAIVTTDAGNFSGWAQRYIKYGRPGRLLAPTSGAMGYALPSAISASLEMPNRTVVGLAGDGGTMMTVQELATAAKYGAKPIFILFNNGVYGTIRMHQARDYPERRIATELHNPDFVQLAHSFGLDAVRVTSNDAFVDALNQAIAAKKMFIIEVRNDPMQMTTTKSLAEIESF